MLSERYEVAVQVYDSAVFFGTVYVVFTLYGTRLPEMREVKKKAVLNARRRGYLTTGLSFGERRYTGVRADGYYAHGAAD